MARMIAFIENEMYVRNFLSSGAFDPLIARGALRLSASEAVRPESLRPWSEIVTTSYERSRRNRDLVFGFNKLSILRYRSSSTTFDIKVRTGLPFGRYGLIDRLKCWPPVYDRVLRPAFAGRLERNPSLERVIGDERPALVLLPLTGVEATGYELIRLSRDHGFRTLFLVNGWDNLSSKAVFAELPDYLGVWGQQALEDAMAIHGLPSHRGFLLGCARYETYFEQRDPGPSPFPFPYAVFAGATTACDELTPLRRIDDELQRIGAGAFRVVYRPHPWREKRIADDLFEPRRFRHTVLDPQVEEAYFANKRSGDESVSSKAMPRLDYYRHLLEHAAFVVSPLSSMTLEAALFNVPAIVLTHDDGIHPLPCSLIARFRHFDGARNVQGWHFVDRLDQLAPTLRQVWELTRNDSPSKRYFAPYLARAMAPYLFMDARSYGGRLLDAVDTILEREASHAQASSRPARRL
jgi:hypothetical protein